MATNYSDWTLAQLEREKARIEKAIDSKEGETRKSVISQISSLAKQHGFDVGELFGSSSPATRGPGRKKKVSSKKKASSKKRSKVAPKYRNPNGPETWAGRGRMPRWVSEHVEAGGSKEDFAI